MSAIVKIIGWLLATAAALLLGGYFLLKRDDIPYDVLRARYASPASHYAVLPGGAVAHFRDEGDRQGRTILLIHGYGASLHTWAPWVRALGGAYRLVSVDLPGHGLTQAPHFTPTITNYADFVEAFAEAENLGRVTVVGNSMGGWTAWMLALRHPERVDALVLACASGWPPPADAKPPLFLQLIRNPVLGPLLKNLDNTLLLRATLKAAFVDQALATDAMVKRYADLARAPGHREILLAAAERTGGFATPEALAKITAPTLILQGAGDKLVDPRFAHRFNAAIPGSKLIVYENVGHIPQEEIPEKSAADLRAFLTPSAPAGAALTSPAQP